MAAKTVQSKLTQMNLWLLVALVALVGSASGNGLDMAKAAGQITVGTI